jgi:hypothetical protein
MRMKRTVLVTAAVLVVGALPVTVSASAATPTPAAATQHDFRVEPYLQNPSHDAMLITWFSESDAPGHLTVRGPGLGRGFQVRTEPVFMPELDSTDRERSQSIAGLEQGSWILGERTYKHQAQVTGLRPDQRYHYTVQQGASTFTAEFRTAPTADRWRSIRFVALADSETEPFGRVNRREWAPGAVHPDGEPRPSAEVGGEWDQRFGTTVLSQVRTLRYPLTEDDGYRANLDVIEERDPALVVMPGDLVQGGGYQPGWDEFFRHNAGELGNLLSRRAILPALGNWENFGAINGGYGTPADRSPVVRARSKYLAYFDPPANDTPAHTGTYHRIDYGPLTFLTLDSSNGEPDDRRANYPVAARATGQQFNGPGTDTQENFTREEYEAAGGTDLADFGPGSEQWQWVERQLAQARAAGQVVFVQFHHSPFSSGEHGLPMDHVQSSGQGGTPMQVYHELFERYAVAAVFSGHSEMFERSFVDRDGDGLGVHYYDVGVAGDGLRGEQRNGTSLLDPLLRYNPYRQWTADQDEPELWRTIDGVRQLVAGGKHYGHLEVEAVRLAPHRGRQGPARGGAATRLTFRPVYVFPIFDASDRLVGAERRVYDDEVVLHLDRNGRIIADSTR